MWKDMLGAVVIAFIILVAAMLFIASAIEWWFSLLAL